MTLEEKFGLKLRELRIATGLTQAEFAERVALSPASISNIEKGKYPTSFGRLEAFAETLGVEVYELFYFKKNPAVTH